MEHREPCRTKIVAVASGKEGSKRKQSVLDAVDSGDLLRKRAIHVEFGHIDAKANRVKDSRRHFERQYV